MKGCVGNLSVVIVIPLNFSQRKSSIREGESCNVATPNSGRHLWWTRHQYVHLAAAAQPLFDPEESNPVDRKMRGRDALNLHGSGSQLLLSQNYWTLNNL
ncbi:hypothetical protein TNCV_4033471 [Trichonephila clavipes]|nr:hypothetical protein TNCV_4033471 [Trichonephila clavipes]